MPRGERPGVALLEVLVALAILGAAGSAMLALAIGTERSVSGARAESTRMLQASRFMDKVALWDRSELDMRLGTRRQGAWRLYIARELPTVYTLQLRDSIGGRVLLETTVFRADTTAAETVDAAR